MDIQDKYEEHIVCARNGQKETEKEQLTANRKRGRVSKESKIAREYERQKV